MIQHNLSNRLKNIIKNNKQKLPPADFQPLSNETIMNESRSRSEKEPKTTGEATGAERTLLF